MIFECHVALLEVKCRHTLSSIIRHALVISISGHSNDKCTARLRMEIVVVSFSDQAHKHFVTRPVHKNFAAIVASSRYPTKESE